MFELERAGSTATRHQAEVGTSWFDRISSTISGGASSTLALAGSTEEPQFGPTSGNGHHPAPEEIGPVTR